MKIGLSVITFGGILVQTKLRGVWLENVLICPLWYPLQKVITKPRQCSLSPDLGLSSSNISLTNLWSFTEILASIEEREPEMRHRTPGISKGTSYIIEGK